MRRPVIIIVSASVLAVLLFVAYLLIMQGIFNRASSLTVEPASFGPLERVASVDVPQVELDAEVAATPTVPVDAPLEPTPSSTPAEQPPAVVVNPRQADMITAGYTADDIAIAQALMFDANNMWRADSTGARYARENGSSPVDCFTVAAQYVRDRYGSWAGAQAQALASNGRW